MKKYLISGFNIVQDVKLEAGTYTLVAYVKSMYGDVYTFALGDGTDWEEFSIDVIQGQLCKVWLTFTIDKKATKFKPIANNFTEELPVYVADLQLTRGNIPVEAGASPFDIDQILNDLHDEIDAIEDFTNEAFADGLLNREEKTQLRASLDAIGSIVESVKGSYNKLLNNPFIHEDTMDAITLAYEAFMVAWINSDFDPKNPIVEDSEGNRIDMGGLKDIIDWIVKGDHIVDENERAEKDRALDAFNDALYAYNQAEKEVYNDVQEDIDAAVIKATYWSIKASAPVIYKDANSATTSGIHTPVTVTGELRSGTTTTQGGFISIQPNGGAESTATASPRTIAPTNAEGKTSYTVRLYEKADKATLLDTMTIPVVFKGASGVNAINVSLSNEADVLPASPEGVVSDYTGSGTIIRVFEGATELTYGTGNGQYQVSASGSGINVGASSTVGNTRVYGVASNMTSDNATITFTISGKTSSGASFSLTKVQTFAKSRVGQKGKDGKTLSISASATSFKYSKTGVATPNEITVKALASNTTITRWDYSINGGTFTANIPYGVSTGIGYVRFVKEWTNFNTLTIKVTDGTLEDSLTITKVYEGKDGEPPKILSGYPKTQYAIGDSKTIYPTSGWGEAIIDVTESKPYLWSRQEIEYDSGDTLYTGYLMLTNITPVAYMAGEWDLRVAYTRNDKSYPIVTYKKGTNNRPLYYYPKKDGVIGYEYFVLPPLEPSSGWYKKGDIVWYEDTNEDYPIILGLYKANKDTRFNPYSDDWDNVTADYAPNGVEGQKLWEFADGMELIITEALMANFAKLDSFVFHKGKMFSQEGTLRGVAGSYEYTDEDHEPNFEVEGASGKVKMKDAQVSGQYISPYNIDILTKGGVDNYIDVTKYSNFYVPSMPNGSNQGWYETLLPNEQKYNGLTLNFIWKPFGTGYHWRIKHLSGVIYTENGVVTELDFTSDTDRIIQLAGFWNSGNSRLEWVVTMNKKIGTKKEDRVKAGEIFLTGDINSDGNLLASNSNFGFTFTSQKVVGEIGHYVVSLAKSPNNPLTSTNYMPIITPIAWSTPVFAGAQYPSKASFTVYTRSQIGGVDAQFRFALLATQDLDLRNQYGL